MNVANTPRLHPFLIPTLAGVIAAGLASGALAETRKFVVMLAVPGKSVDGGVGGLVLPNPNDVYDQYLDHDKENVASFAEWWEEVSYQNVTVIGDVYGWVELPWPVLPNGPNFSVPSHTPGPVSRLRACL